MTMAMFVVRPRAVESTGDHTPASSLFRYVWRMSGCHQISICLLALLVASLSMIPLELQRRMINQAIEGENQELLFVFGAAFVGVLLVQALCKYVLRLYQGWLSESAIRYNRHHLSKLYRSNDVDPEDKAEETGEGQAVSVIGSEIDKLGGFVGEGLSQPTVNIGMLLAIAGYMLVVEPYVALFSFLFLVPQIIAVPIVQHFINGLIEKRVQMLRDLSNSVSSLKTKGSTRQPRALSESIDCIYENHWQIFLLKFAIKSSVNFVNALAPLSVLVLGGYLVIQGETSLGVVVAFVSGFDRLSNPLRELLGYYRVAAQAHVQHKMIARWM